MGANLVLAVGFLGAGALILLASWIVHWALVLLGAAVIVVGMYLALGGQIAGI